MFKISYMEKSELATVFQALEFAASKHRDQRRKDKHATPYINHPIALVGVLITDGDIDDYEVISAALLHDTIEDTDTSEAELKHVFGANITAIVQEVSDDKNLSKKDRKEAQIAHSSSLSTKAKLVKLADKICNLRDISSNPPEGWNLARRQEYFDWAGKVVDGLRGESSKLEMIFDSALSDRPKS